MPKTQSLHDQAQSSGQHPSREEMHKQFQAMDQEMEQQLKPIPTTSRRRNSRPCMPSGMKHPPGTQQGARPSQARAEAGWPRQLTKRKRRNDGGFRRR